MITGTNAIIEEPSKVNTSFYMGGLLAETNEKSFYISTVQYSPEGSAAKMKQFTKNFV